MSNSKVGMKKNKKCTRRMEWGHEPDSPDEDCGYKATVWWLLHLKFSFSSAIWMLFFPAAVLLHYRFRSTEPHKAISIHLRNYKQVKVVFPSMAEY